MHVLTLLCDRYTMALPCDQCPQDAQAERHAEEDRAWELTLSKKYNDLAGIKETAGWQLDLEQQRAEVTWEAAYSDQNTEHAFTGVLQRFEKPLGDSNHEVLSVWNPQVRPWQRCLRSHSALPTTRCSWSLENLQMCNMAVRFCVYPLRRAGKRQPCVETVKDSAR